MTSPADLRALDDDELHVRLAETQEELFNLRFQRVTGQLDNTARLRQLRREIARVKTIQREREIAEALGLEDWPSLSRPARPGWAADAERPDAQGPDAERQDAERRDEEAVVEAQEGDAGRQDDEEEAP
jgi:large subunit ribosomal protein L29